MEEGERTHDVRVDRLLPHHSASGLDLPLEARGESVRLLACRGTDDQMSPAAHGFVAVALQLLGQLRCLCMGATRGPDLPRRIPTIARLLLPRLPLGLVVPPLLAR